MLRPLLAAAASLALIVTAAALASAAPCKDAKGKFTKCPASFASSELRAVRLQGRG